MAVPPSRSILRFIFIAFTLLCLGTGCESPPEELFVRQFNIQAGEHFSTPRLIEVLQSDELAFRATFDESAIYDLENDALQSNKNKLLGFSDCNSLHQENSARFAWQWFNERLEIYAYCYVDGIRTEEFVGVVNLHEENLYKIELREEEYVFYLNGKQACTIPRGNVCDKGVYYMLYPYFGGEVPAPHNIQIQLTIDRLAG